MKVLKYKFISQSLDFRLVYWKEIVEKICNGKKILHEALFIYTSSVRFENIQNKNIKEIKSEALKLFLCPKVCENENNNAANFIKVGSVENDLLRYFAINFENLLKSNLHLNFMHTNILYVYNLFNTLPILGYENSYIHVSKMYFNGAINLVPYLKQFEKYLSRFPNSNNQEYNIYRSKVDMVEDSLINKVYNPENINKNSECMKKLNKNLFYSVQDESRKRRHTHNLLIKCYDKMIFEGTNVKVTMNNSICHLKLEISEKNVSYNKIYYIIFDIYESLKKYAEEFIKKKNKILTLDEENLTKFLTEVQFEGIEMPEKLINFLAEIPFEKLPLPKQFQIKIIEDFLYYWKMTKDDLSKLLFYTNFDSDIETLFHNIPNKIDNPSESVNLFDKSTKIIIEQIFCSYAKRLRKEFIEYLMGNIKEIPMDINLIAEDFYADNDFPKIYEAMKMSFESDLIHSK